MKGGLICCRADTSFFAQPTQPHHITTVWSRLPRWPRQAATPSQFPHSIPLSCRQHTPTASTASPAITAHLPTCTPARPNSRDLYVQRRPSPSAHVPLTTIRTTIGTTTTMTPQSPQLHSPTSHPERPRGSQAHNITHGLLQLTTDPRHPQELQLLPLQFTDIAHHGGSASYKPFIRAAAARP